MRSELSVVVVGAGIGGLATALALSRQGVRSTVWEQAPEIAEIGAGIQLAPNALSVLDRLGVLEDVLVDAVHPPRAAMRDARTGEELTALEFDDAFVQRYGYPYIVTHRADLHRSLLRACEQSGLVRLEVERRVVSVADDGAQVTVRADHGAQLTGDLVVGADGIHGVVRGHVLRAEPPAPVGDVAYRGTVPLADVPPRAGLDDMTWWVGPGMHLIQYPVRQRQLLNQVAVFTSPSFGAVPVESTDWGTPRELHDVFDGTAPPVQHAVSSIEKARRWPLFDRLPSPTWTRGSVALLGDAAHPMVQYLAQGACQALEDALVLGDALAAEPDVASALAAYEAERLPRTARVQTWARRMGDIAHAGGTTAILRDAILRADADAGRPYFDFLYGYRSPYARKEAV